MERMNELAESIASLSEGNVEGTIELAGEMLEILEEMRESA
jgi:hypothetical protein